MAVKATKLPSPSRTPASAKSVIRSANVSYLKEIAVSSTIAPNPTKMMLADMTPSNADGPSLDNEDRLPTDEGKKKIGRSSVTD